MSESNQKIKIMSLLIILLVVFFVIVLFNKKDKNDIISKNFPNCEILVNACNSPLCKYYFLCNETENLNCNVYDCVGEYGIEITEVDGGIVKKTRQILDQSKVQEIISKCSGSPEVLDKKCDGSKSIARVKVVTAGDCEINSFIMAIDGKNRIAKFEKEGDVYKLSVSQCGVISGIKVVGEGGVEIK